jgi:hypothetical protein
LLKYIEMATNRFSCNYKKKATKFDSLSIIVLKVLNALIMHLHSCCLKHP